MEKEISKKTNVETGGILMGFYDSTNIIITEASPPGPNAIHKKHSITFDTDYCQLFVNKVYIESGGSETYLGDWHCHESKRIKPSILDFNTLKKEYSNPENHTTCPIIIIVGSNKNFLPKKVKLPEIQAYYYNGESNVLDQLPIKII